MITAFAEATLYNLWVSTGHERVVYSGGCKSGAFPALEEKSQCAECLNRYALLSITFLLTD